MPLEVDNKPSVAQDLPVVSTPLLVDLQPRLHRDLHEHKYAPLPLLYLYLCVFGSFFFIPNFIFYYSSLVNLVKV